MNIRQAIELALEQEKMAKENIWKCPSLQRIRNPTHAGTDCQGGGKPLQAPAGKAKGHQIEGK